MRKFKYFVADFETTVYQGQEFTEVWASALVELYTEKVEIKNSIDKFMYSIFNSKQNSKIFFHNLKFDGTFILDWLKRQKSFKEKVVIGEDKERHMEKSYNLHHKEYIYQISEKGVYYSITINFKNYLYIFYDSYKILPFSVESIGKAFNTKHQKLSITYEGVRSKNGTITEKEKEYIKNDVLVVKEALEHMFDNGFKKQTIGSDAMHHFKKLYDEDLLNTLFPQVYEMEIDLEIYGQSNAGEYVHKSYRGAWTYCNERYKDQIMYDGCTVDANSLYPSRMMEESYPIGKPKFFIGDIPEEIKNEKYIYFINIDLRFELKKGYLPFIQIKGDTRYNGREMLKSNKIYNKYGYLISDEKVNMTVTNVDFLLMQEHYELIDLKINHGCYFKCIKGIFREYIDYFMNMKINAKNTVERTIAKLLLNNLYGRFAMYHDSSFKMCYLNDNVLDYETVDEHEKIPAYIPVGSMITSYARNTTIRLAQKNYKNFCYADTDSLHCKCRKEELIGVPIDDKKLGFWKVEMEWKRAIFHRSKSYIETTEKDGIESYHITCAGMGKVPKHMLSLALQYRDGNVSRKTILSEDLDETQKEWVLQGADLTDFKTGLTIFGNLKAKRIIGGTILVKSPFKLRA